MGKGSGYVRSSHMESKMGGGGGGGGGSGQVAHGGTLSSGEKNAKVKGPTPTEAKNPGRHSVPAGVSGFEAEMKETFKGGGVANIKGKAMPHANSPVTSDPKSNSHGHVSGKAEHLPHAKAAYCFPTGTMKSSPDSFGYSSGQKSGPLRLSGNRSAHRIGGRGK